MRNALIRNCISGGNGGGISLTGQATVTDLVVRDTSSLFSSGGALYLAGPATLLRVKTFNTMAPVRRTSANAPAFV